MPSIKIRPDDRAEADLGQLKVAVRRLKRACEKAGIFTEVKKREYYVKPTEERKRQKAAARKRSAKKTLRQPTMFRGRRIVESKRS